MRPRWIVSLLWLPLFLAGCSRWGMGPSSSFGREPDLMTMRPDFEVDSRVNVRDSFVRPKRGRLDAGALGPPVIPAPAPADPDAPDVVLSPPEPAFPD